MNADAFPTFRRLFRFILRCLQRLRRIFFSRRSAVVYLILITLGYLAYSIDRWHGRRAWAAEKERLAAAGESLDLHELLPKRPPDEENFCAIPELADIVIKNDPDAAHRFGSLRMWFTRTKVERRDRLGNIVRNEANFPSAGESPLADWCQMFRRTGALPAQPLADDPARELLLSALQWKEMLDHLYEASGRPSSVFVPAPEERVDVNGRIDDRAVHLGLVLGLVRTLTIHGRASIEADDAPAALRDIHVLQRLDEAFRNESTSTGLPSAGAVSRHATAIVRAGMQRHSWSERDLLQFDSTSREEPISSAFQAAMAVERAVLCHMLEDSRNWQAYWFSWGKMPWTAGAKLLYGKIAPEGPFLRYCAQLSQHFSLLAAESKLPAAGELQNSWLDRMRSVEAPGFLGPRFNDNRLGIFAGILIQARVSRAAFALERHFLVHHRYPVALEQVSPASPPNTFIDIDGKPFRYRAAPDGTSFKLWSVGRNGKDDTSDPNVSANENDDWSISTE